MCCFMIIHVRVWYSASGYLCCCFYCWCVPYGKNIAFNLSLLIGCIRTYFFKLILVDWMHALWLSKGKISSSTFAKQKYFDFNLFCAYWTPTKQILIVEQQLLHYTMCLSFTVCNDVIHHDTNESVKTFIHIFVVIWLAMKMTLFHITSKNYYHFISML